MEGLTQTLARMPSRDSGLIFESGERIAGFTSILEWHENSW